MTDQNVDVSIVLPVLKKIPLFAELDEDLHNQIIQHIVLMYYPEDYSLFKEGEGGDALYIVKKGTVQIFNEPSEEGDLPKRVAEITEGGFFGEMALVSDVPRNASAKTLEESEIFILSKGDFKKLLDTNTALAEQISSTVVSRLHDNDNQG